MSIFRLFNHVKPGRKRKPRIMNIALIGCGRIGFLLEQDPLRYKPCTHYGGAAASGLVINYACDINPARLSAFSEAAGTPRENLFTDSTFMLKKIRPEMAIIAAWTETHHEIAMEAMNSGVKVIVLEKPVTSDIKKARDLVRSAEKNNTLVIVSHERRYDSRYMKVKRLIESGKIGSIKTVHASILTSGHRGKSLPEHGGGPLLHDGTHMIDMVRFLFGEIVSLRGEFQRDSRASGFEDRAAAWLTTETGVDIFLEAGGSRKYFIFELRISGTEGQIVIGNGYETMFLGKKSRLYSGFNDLRERAFPRYRRNNCFIDMYREAGTLLKHTGGKAKSSLHDGVRALEIIHCIYYSSCKGGITMDLRKEPPGINLKKIFNLG